MAEISQRDQLALHEFSVRYRAALTARAPDSQKNLGVWNNVVRDQYEKEQQLGKSQIQEPEIGPSKQPEPPEPEIE